MTRTHTPLTLCISVCLCHSHINICCSLLRLSTYKAVVTNGFGVTRRTYWISRRGNDTKCAVTHFVANTFNFSKKKRGGSNMASELHAGPTLSISGFFPTWSCVAWQPHSKHDGIPWGPGVSQCVTPASPAFHYKTHTHTHIQYIQT